jgi:hypothetical protein
MWPGSRTQGRSSQGIRIRIVFRSWIRIRIRTKSWMLIRIQVKIQEALEAGAVEGRGRSKLRSEGSK